MIKLAVLGCLWAAPVVSNEVVFATHAMVYQDLGSNWHIEIAGHRYTIIKIEHDWKCPKCQKQLEDYDNIRPD